MARTGSGKTAAFLIPLVEKLLSSASSTNMSTSSGVRAVVLSPTRELSQQTLRVLRKLNSSISAIGIHGGETMEKQFSLLASRPAVIVATPGRLAHHVTEIPDFSLSSVQFLVLDEADRLLEQGLAAQIRQIAHAMPSSTQKVLLSATLPKVLVDFTRTGFCSSDPTVVRLESEATVSTELRQVFVTCRSADKDAALLHVLSHIQVDTAKNEAIRTGLTLIFVATRHHVEYLAAMLQALGRKDVSVMYGTMDQQARQQNLQKFRNRIHPIMIVTDVAARGIDVPLIDHVVHYHFAPTPKLYVHRSGRAARAGRIGFCWSLAEPDEIPYMMELHLFLGRPPAPCSESYSLAQMTPDMVHFGSLPENVTEIETVSRLMHSELTGTDQAASLRVLTRVCQNAMQQYRKTRPEASREAVRRAQALLEGRKLSTGQRVEQSTIPPHPLFGGTEKTQKERHDFLRAVSNYRPKETVFETNKTNGSNVVSQVDKGRTTAAHIKTADSSLVAMQHMRRQMRMVRDRDLVVAGTQDNASGEPVERDDASVEGQTDLAKNDHSMESTNNDTTPNSTVSSLLRQSHSVPIIDGKRRLSKAERKRLKKNPGASVALSAPPAKSSSGTASSFRDPVFFIDHVMESDHSRRVEAAMQQPRESQSQAVRLEEAMMEVVGDEREELVQKQRLMRWDKSKRKYIQTTVGDELRGDSKTKKLRLESGQLMRESKLKLGDLYQKWQKKTNRSVGRVGVFDDGAAAADTTAVEPDQDRSSKKDARRRGGNEKVKTSRDIKKEREKKRQNKLRNMSKGDRRKLEGRSGGSAKPSSSSFRKGKR